MVLGGYFEVEAMLSKIGGTAFDMFTIHGDQSTLGWQDQHALKVASVNPLKALLLNVDPRYATCFAF